MAERLNALGWKPDDGNVRGFESLSLRQGQVMKLVDNAVSETVAFGRVGSSPTLASIAVG